MNDQENYNKAEYDIENLKFQSKLYELFYKHLPKEVVLTIQHKEIIHCGLRGYYKIFNDKVERRYLMDLDGKWYEVPKGINWIDKGLPVNDDTLQAFILEIQSERND